MPHPFGQYLIDLRADGSVEWLAVCPVKEGGGEVKVGGSGTWRASGDRLHYTSGDSGSTVQYFREGDKLVLDGLPGTKVGPGVRCVFVRATPVPPPAG